MINQFSFVLAIHFTRLYRPAAGACIAPCPDLLKRFFPFPEAESTNDKGSNRIESPDVREPAPRARYQKDNCESQACPSAGGVCKDGMRAELLPDFHLGSDEYPHREDRDDNSREGAFGLVPMIDINKGCNRQPGSENIESTSGDLERASRTDYGSRRRSF